MTDLPLETSLGGTVCIVAAYSAMFAHRWPSRPGFADFDPGELIERRRIPAGPVEPLTGFYRAETLFSSILWGGMSVPMMITGTSRADSPTVSFMFFRLLAVFLFALDLAKAVAMGEWAGVEFWVFGRS